MPEIRSRFKNTGVPLKLSGAGRGLYGIQQGRTEDCVNKIIIKQFAYYHTNTFPFRALHTERTGVY